MTQYELGAIWTMAQEMGMNRLAVNYFVNLYRGRLYDLLDVMHRLYIKEK